MNQVAELLLKGRRPYLLLALATLAVWGQTVRFGFVWDDNYFIRDLQSVRSLRHVPEMFYRLDAQSTVPDGFVLFRPIRTAHYALLHALDGAAVPQPWIYHLANVLWHGATSMMLFAVLTLLLPQLHSKLSEDEVRGWSLFAALAFAIHPVTSEVVCWAKSLDDILAAFFVLAALWQLLQPPTDASRLWRALLFFALALYSKESAVPFAFVPLVVFRGIHRLPWKQCLARTAWFMAVAAVYTVHRHLVIGRTSQTAPISGSYFQTLLDMFPVVLKYLRLLLGIPPFFIDYTYLRGGYSLLSPAVLAGLAVLLALTVLGVSAWRGRQTALFGFGLLWMGLFLLPVSNLLPMMQYMAERFLYLPLIGWLIVLAAAGLVLRRSNILSVVGLLIVLLWAGIAWNRSWIWQDDLTLFVRSAQEGPRTPRVQENAVAAILELPNVRAVFSYDRKANLLSSRDTADAAARGSALRTFESARQIFPEAPVILSCLGISLATCGQPEKGLPYLQQASVLSPSNLAYALNYARAGLDAKQFALARSALDKASALAPEDPAVLQLRFQYFWLQEDRPAARQVLLRLNQLAPSDEITRRLTAVANASSN
jgi:protein O-mannosyl-transferase